jgi:hypothetical protein
MRKVPPAEEWYPKCGEELKKTDLPTVIVKVTTEPPPKPAVCQPRPEGWWKEYPWIIDYGREPTAFELLHDFVTGKVFISSEAVTIASSPPSRLILFEISHPTRGVEYARLFLSPTDVMEGPSDEEPDLIVRMDYYEFVAILCGDISPLHYVWENRGTVIGNITVGLDICDIVEAANGRKMAPGHPTPIPRPKIWPLGHP